MNDLDLSTQWVLQPQTQEGNYWFSGLFHISTGVRELLSEEEIFWVYMEVQGLAVECQGLHFHQVFKRASDGMELCFTAYLSKAQVDSGLFSLVDNYCRLRLASEEP